jgi:hypothetical protein
MPQPRPTLVPPRARRAPHIVLLALLAASATACAGSTFRSGVGDTFVEHPPYYAGVAARDTAPVAHLPIAYQRGATQPAMFDPAADGGTPLAALLVEMNAYLDSLGVSVRAPVAGTPAGTPPDVQFGCVTDASGDCATAGDDAPEVAEVGRPCQRLAVARPSAEWVTWLGGALDGARADRALVLTLEVGQYMPRQRSLRGDKEVELGTGHAVPLPWLTSLETPVSVLQLTGALVGRDGRAVRIGAEGLLARRTRLAVSALGTQQLISPEDVERLRTARRDDLADRPLVWQAAVRRMAAELTGRGR